MAAIDKMYVHSYYEYDALRKWAIAYFPELLFFFYDISMTYEKWEKICHDYVLERIEISKRDYKKLGNFSSISEAKYNLKQHYLKSANYVCPTKQVISETKDIITNYSKTEDDWEQSFSYPITSTPFWVDRKLLWRCPLPFVRKYLEKQCGYKTKWYHKLFFKGKNVI